jgi:hypothetical protein
VETTGGRRFTGDVDRHSDEHVLWLCRAHGRSAILRPIDWDSIVTVELANTRYTGQQFRSALQTVRGSLPPADEPSEAGATTIRLAGAREVPDVATVPVEIGYRRVGGLPKPPAPIVPIRWLEIDVRVANWDPDVEADGLLVRIRPRDAEGVLVAVDGTLTVDLVGKEKSPVNRRRDFVDLGRWTEQVRPEDFGIDGAIYRIPFQARNPVFDTDLVPNGLVHVQLAVPGQGLVEASDCTVQFRPYNAFRDDLWQATGSRYWPLEWHDPGGR